jgi:hypothetical protein
MGVGEGGYQAGMASDGYWIGVGDGGYQDQAGVVGGGYQIGVGDGGYQIGVGDGGYQIGVADGGYQIGVADGGYETGVGDSGCTICVGYAVHVAAGTAGGVDASVNGCDVGLGAGELDSSELGVSAGGRRVAVGVAQAALTPTLGVGAGWHAASNVATTVKAIQVVVTRRNPVPAPGNAWYGRRLLIRVRPFPPAVAHCFRSYFF